MDKRKLYFLGIGVFALLFIIVGIVTTLSNNNNINANDADVPEEVSELIDKYYSALKKGTEETIEYIHFEDDEIKEVYLESGSYLIDYRIEDIEKVNEQLYALTTLAKTNTSVLHQGDEFKKVYNFVGNIDGEWYFMNGISHIPESISDNLDPSKYSYDDEKIVNKEDVMLP